MELKSYNLFVASGNKHKASELIEVAEIVFPQTQMRWTARGPKKVEETESNYLGNALIKMRSLAEELQTEMSDPFAILADDSGLEVSGLNGAPGVISARYSGAHQKDPTSNMLKVLSELKNFPLGSAERNAQFRCSLVLGFFNFQNKEWTSKEFIGEGLVKGVIELEAKGHQGFGYDPIFFYPPFKKRFSEMTSHEKNKISHRRQAFENLKARLGQKSP